MMMTGEGMWVQKQASAVRYRGVLQASGAVVGADAEYGLGTVEHAKIVTVTAP